MFEQPIDNGKEIHFHSRLSKHWTDKGGALRAFLGVVQQTHSRWVQEDSTRLNYVMQIKDVMDAIEKEGGGRTDATIM